MKWVPIPWFWDLCLLWLWDVRVVAFWPAARYSFQWDCLYPWAHFVVYEAHSSDLPHSARVFEWRDLSRSPPSHNSLWSHITRPPVLSWSRLSSRLFHSTSRSISPERGSQFLCLSSRILATWAAYVLHLSHSLAHSSHFLVSPAQVQASTCFANRTRILVQLAPSRSTLVRSLTPTLRTSSSARHSTPASRFLSSLVCSWARV